MHVTVLNVLEELIGNSIHTQLLQGIVDNTKLFFAVDVVRTNDPSSLRLTESIS